MKNDKLTTQQKKDILEGKGQVGGKYCNAIDEDPYNSDDWHNRMPVSAWGFHTCADGRVSVCWDEVFACYDGWDSHTYDAEYFDNMEIAVNSIWTRQAVDKIFDFIQALKNSAKIERNWDFDDKTIKIIDVESRPHNGTYQIDTFDMDKLLDTLRNDVYPSMRGKEVDL